MARLKTSAVRAVLGNHRQMAACMDLNTIHVCSMDSQHLAFSKLTVKAITLEYMYASPEDKTDASPTGDTICACVGDLGQQLMLRLRDMPQLSAHEFAADPFGNAKHPPHYIHYHHSDSSRSHPSLNTPTSALRQLPRQPQKQRLNHKFHNPSPDLPHPLPPAFIIRHIPRKRIVNLPRQIIHQP